MHTPGRDDQNPYAPSRASLKVTENVQDVDGDTGSRVWRDGGVLVALIGAALPDRCVKCNGLADQPTRPLKLYWHHRGLYALVLVNIVIYAIVASIVRKKAFVSAGLCTEHKRRRRTASMLAWTGSLGGIVLLYLGMGSSWGAWGALLGAVLILGSIICGLIFGRTLHAEKIDKSYVRLKGCGTVFLDSLPPFAHSGRDASRP